jgi:hypothetical protein
VTACSITQVWGGGGEGVGDQSFGGEGLLFLWHSQVQVEHL